MGAVPTVGHGYSLPGVQPGCWPVERPKDVSSPALTLTLAAAVPNRGHSPGGALLPIAHLTSSQHHHIASGCNQPLPDERGEREGTRERGRERRCMAAAFNFFLFMNFFEKLKKATDPLLGKNTRMCKILHLILGGLWAPLIPG